MPGDRDELPAVRVYTVCDESRYLIVRNVPALGCGQELEKLFSSFGEIEECKPMDAENAESFTDVFWIKFFKDTNARFAKRKLDEFVFYGNRLQISYAPQFESLSDTVEKLEGRRKEVLLRLKFLPGMAGKSEAPKTPVSSQSHSRFSSSYDVVTASSSTSCFQQERLNQSVKVKSDAVMAHVSSGKEYFSSQSMNNTAIMVREKLEKIAQSNVNYDVDQQSKKVFPEKRRRI
ncbi:uncharacterized protein LOC144703537 [Wolffia australiana]